MKLLEIILFEYVLGYILQGFAMILGIYAYCRQKIEFRKYLISSVIMIVIIYIMRLLPINFGVHTILDFICAFLIGILYLKMPVLSTIRSIVVITVLLLLTELLNVFIMTNILGKQKFDLMMSDAIQKYIVGLPAALIFALLIVISYFVLMRLKTKKSVKDGENSR